MISFTWDSRKNATNRRKHGVSFEEARTVFYDEYAVRYFDPDHSHGEDRFLMLGIASSLRVLIVNHSYTEHDAVIRIISARKATRREEETYWRERS